MLCYPEKRTQKRNFRSDKESNCLFSSSFSPLFFPSSRISLCTSPTMLAVQSIAFDASWEWLCFQISFFFSFVAQKLCYAKGCQQINERDRTEKERKQKLWKNKANCSNCLTFVSKKWFAATFRSPYQLKIVCFFFAATTTNNNRQID